MTLQVGMLWFDNAPDRPLPAKLSLAARHYEQKYGRAPNVCYLNLNTPGHDQGDAAGLRLHAANDILPHHFWLGVAE
jgi:hypothetical protein